MKKLGTVQRPFRAAGWWTEFFKGLQTGGGTNAEGYVAQFTRAANLKPALYQFGDRQVTL